MEYVIKVDQKGTKAIPAASGYIAKPRPISTTKTGARFELVEQAPDAFRFKSRLQVKCYASMRLEKNSALASYDIEELPE